MGRYIKQSSANNLTGRSRHWANQIKSNSLLYQQPPVPRGWGYYDRVNLTIELNYKLKGTAHLKQHSYQMALFSSGMKIFKIAFQHVVDNSCMVPIAPFSTTNFGDMTLF